MVWFLTLLIFLAALCSVVGVLALMVDLGTDRARLNARLEEEFQTLRQPENGTLLLKDLGRLAAEAAAGQPHTGPWNRLDVWLQQAGLSNGALRWLLAWTVWLALALGGLGWLPLGLSGAVLAGLLGAALPWLYVRWRRGRRLNQLRAQVPDALETIAQVLRAGHTLPQGVLAVARDGRPPLSVEFASCYEQQNLGLAPEAAYGELARRTDLPELKLFAITTAVHQQTGGNAEVLDRLASMVRDRLRTLLKLKTMTTESRLQANILLGLPPVVFVALWLLRGAYVAILFEHPWLLVGMAGWQMIGWLWIRQILNRG